MPGEVLTSADAYTLGLSGGVEAVGDEGFDVISILLTSKD